MSAATNTMGSSLVGDRSGCRPRRKWGSVLTATNRRSCQPSRCRPLIGQCVKAGTDDASAERLDHGHVYIRRRRCLRDIEWMKLFAGFTVPSAVSADAPRPSLRARVIHFVVSSANQRSTRLSH